MEHSIWKNVCQQPTLVAHCQHYGKLVTDSTIQLHQCVQNILSVLNDRAIGLTRCAEFDAALLDAAAMQEISPKSALGYLCAATIYYEQGRQRAAMDICDEGMKIAYVHDPDYTKLQQAKLVAKQRDTKRLDFVSQLPLDIATTVLLPMLMDEDEPLDALEPYPLLHVSNAWCDRVIQTSGGGLHFRIDSKESKPCTQIIRFAQHTRSLYIYSYSRGRWLPDLLANGNMCSLQEIWIKGITNAINVDPLVSSLQSVSNTLIHLTISDLCIEPLSVVDILINCPNLVSLDITNRYNADFSALPTTRRWTQLTTLCLYDNYSVTRNGQILEILKRFPSLEKLALDPCIETQPMTVIQHYCRSIRDLQFVTGSLTSRPERLGQEQQYEHQLIECRLEKLSILGRFQNSDSDLDVHHMLKQHHCTLVYLQLSLNHAGDIDHDLYTMEYPCLKTLDLHCTRYANACFGWWILNKAPFLEELSITAESIKASPTLLDTRPSNLRKLMLDIYVPYLLEDLTVIERYIGHYAQENSPLRELKIRLESPNDATAILASICRLKRLQYLMVSYTLRWNPFQMERFLARLVEGCPQLLSLEMGCSDSPSVSSIQALKRLAHLRYLALAIDDTTKCGIICDALLTLSQLKFIRIFPEHKINHSAIRCLKEQRPDLKVAIDKCPPKF